MKCIKRRIARAIAMLLSVELLLASVPQTLLEVSASEGIYLENQNVGEMESGLEAMENSDILENEDIAETEETEDITEVTGSGDIEETEQTESENTDSEDVPEPVEDEDIIPEKEDENITDTDTSTTEKEDEAEEVLSAESDLEGDVVDISFAGSNFTVKDSDGNLITKLTFKSGTTFDKSNCIDFNIVPDVGYTIKSVKCSYESLGVKGSPIKGSLVSGKYYIMSGTWTQDATIEIETVETADYTLTITYPATDVDVKLENISLDNTSESPASITISNTQYTTLYVKAAQTDTDSRQIPKMSLKMGSGDRYEDYECDEYDPDEEDELVEAGYYRYSLGKIFEDTDVKITVEEACEISFDWGGTPFGYIERVVISDKGIISDEIAGSLIVKKGESVCFRVSNNSMGTVYVSTIPETAVKESYIEAIGDYVYEITPLANLTAHLELRPKDVPLTYNSEDILEVSIYDSYDDDYGNEVKLPASRLSDDKKSIGLYQIDEDITLNFTLVEGKSISSAYGKYSENNGSREYTSKYNVTKLYNGSYDVRLNNTDFDLQEIVIETDGSGSGSTGGDNTGDTTKGLHVVLKQILPDGSETEVEMMDNVFNVRTGGDYVLSVRYGNELMELTNITSKGLFEGRYTIRENGKEADMHIPEKIVSYKPVKAMRTLIYCWGKIKKNNKILETSVKFTIRLVEELDSVTLDGIDEDRLNVIQDRVAVCTVNSSSKQLPDFSDIGIEVTMKNGVNRNLLNLYLKPTDQSAAITVIADPDTPIGEVAAVKLYHKGRLPDDKNYYIKGGEFKINVSEPEDVKKSQPTVNLKSADDVSLTLNIGGVDEVGSCSKGGQYYKIEVLPKTNDGQEIPSSISEATKATYFIERKLGGNNDKNFVQTEKLVVNNSRNNEDYPLGQAWDFDVNVSLIQTRDRTIKPSNMQILYSGNTKSITASTKTPSFPTEIKLKKVATKIYTTQKNMIAASVGFDKNAVCVDTEVSDITYKTGALSASVIDGQLIVSAPKGTQLGKHTLEIKLIGPNSLYQQTAKFDITVVKGIEKLNITLPSSRIYKKGRGSAGLKATVSYNAGDISASTKKVQWSIIDEEDTSVGEDGKSLFDYITVKNGKITVKGSLPMDDGEEYQFRIKVIADDYKGNTVSAVSDLITVTSSRLVVSELIIVQPSGDGYKVVARDNSVPITTDLLKDARLVAIGGIEEDYEDDEGDWDEDGGIEGDIEEPEDVKEYYTSDELAQIQIAAAELSVKSSAPKSVLLSKEGSNILIKAGKPSKNIRLSVTTNDGGRKSASMKLNISYKKPDSIGLRVKQGDNVLINAADSKDKAEFMGTINTKLTLNVMQKNGSPLWEVLNAYTDHSIKIKGGKILKSDIENGQYVVNVTGSEAVITLQDKANKKKYTYTLTNAAYSANSRTKVSVKANKNKNKVLTVGADSEYKMEYGVAGNYSYQSKYVIVESDAVSEHKKPDLYEQLKSVCTVMDGSGVRAMGTPIPVASDGIVVLNFINTKNIAAGSYKLTLTFGTLQDNVFIADTKPVTVTLKAAKPKVIKGSYSVTKNYQIAANAGSGVDITGKGKNVKSVVYENIKGKNVNGAENKFLKYFELQKTGDSSTCRVVLKSGLSADDIAAAKKSQKDCTGYLTYTAVYGDNGYGEPYTVTNTVQIKIKLK